MSEFISIFTHERSERDCMSTNPTLEIFDGTMTTKIFNIIDCVGDVLDITGGIRAITV